MPDFPPSPLSLRVNGLDLVRGEHCLATALTFDVPAGSALAVVGANGSGKSTLLRTIAGLLPFERGTITLQGADGANDTPIATLAHYLGHQDALKPALSVGENLSFWASMLQAQGADVQTRLLPVAALDRFGLAHVVDTPAGYLSAGQRRRAALARLLVAPRPLWLLDEPAAALDTGSMQRLDAVMAEHLKQGGLIVAATHEPLAVAGRELRLGDDDAPDRGTGP